MWPALEEGVSRTQGATLFSPSWGGVRPDPGGSVFTLTLRRRARPGVALWHLHAASLGCLLFGAGPTWVGTWEHLATCPAFHCCKWAVDGLSVSGFSLGTGLGRSPSPLRLVVKGAMWGPGHPHELCGTGQSSFLQDSVTDAGVPGLPSMAGRSCGLGAVCPAWHQNQCGWSSRA